MQLRQARRRSAATARTRCTRCTGSCQRADLDEAAASTRLRLDVERSNGRIDLYTFGIRIAGARFIVAAVPSASNT